MLADWLSLLNVSLQQTSERLYYKRTQLLHEQAQQPVEITG